MSEYLVAAFMFKKILVIIPCYNEEVSLPTVIDSIKQLKMEPKYKIIPLVINDCSKDNTLPVARNLKIKVIDLPCNLGIGGTVQTGLKYAYRNNFDLAVQMDGDGQHPAPQLSKLLKAYEDTNADVIVGSRFIDKQGFQSSFVRRLGIRYFYFLNKLLTGNPIYDSTSGYRLLGKKAIEIGAKNYPDDYPEPESLVIFSKLGLTIKEVPILMNNRYGGVSSISNSRSIYYSIKVSLAMIYSYIRKQSK